MALSKAEIERMTDPSDPPGVLIGLWNPQYKRTGSDTHDPLSSMTQRAFGIPRADREGSCSYQMY